MKYVCSITGLMLALAATSPALPLQQGLAPHDAKWLVQLDVDALRDSKVGTILIKDKLAAQIAQLKTDMKIDVELILQKLHSITAFGTDFQMGPEANGVLVLSGGEELRTIAEGLLAAQILQNPDGPVKQLQREPYAVYSVHNQIFVSPGLAGHVVASKSRAQIESFRDALSGKAKTGGASEAFSGYAKVANSFFFLAVAEGFNETTALPPQAKILKMAEGARIVLGEKGEMLFLNLALKAKEAEVVRQIAQVLEGIKAVVALGQSENKELLELVQSIKVASTEKMVTVNLEYPLAKVIGKFDELTKHSGKNPEKPAHAKHRKNKSDSSAKPEPTAEDQ